MLEPRYCTRVKKVAWNCVAFSLFGTLYLVVFLAQWGGVCSCLLYGLALYASLTVSLAYETS